MYFSDSMLLDLLFCLFLSLSLNDVLPLITCLLSGTAKNTTTTIIFQKSFASDATPKRHLMTHRMKNLCLFSVFHCVEGHWVRHPGVPPK